MSFEFLAPDAAQPSNGSRPALRSPIEWTLRDQWANFTERADKLTCLRGHGSRPKYWCPMTLGRVLALTPPERTADVRDLLEAAASAAPFASVIEMTAAYGSNALVGPLSRETFARTMALDLRPDHFAEGDFAPVSVARTPGMVLREGGDRFLHLFGAGFAHYVWTVFVDAARHLGGRAVGVTALGATTSTEEVAHA